MPPTAAAAARDTQFNWEGKDKKGNKIRGKILAVNEQDARADLRRQNIVPTKVSKHRKLFGGGGKITPDGHRDVQPPARDHARGRHPAGAGLRDRRRRPRKAGDAEADPRHQADHRGRQFAARIAREAPALFRRPLRQPGRGRRAGGRARVAARQGRDLQGKDRGPQEEDQEGALLSGRGARGRGDRDPDPAAVRDPAVRGTVQGLRRGPARFHAHGHRPVEVRAGTGLVDGPADRRRRRLLPAHEEALAGAAALPGPRCRSRSRSSGRS